MTEVLVSILVLAAGTLGAAGMHLAAQRASQRAALQTAALHIATVIADRMRGADRLAALAVHLPLDYRASAPAPDDTTYPCYASDCAPADMAGFELEEWKALVRSELPGGRLQICPQPDGAARDGWECAPASMRQPVLVIRIGWQEKRMAGGPPQAAQGPDTAPAIVLAVAQTAL